MSALHDEREQRNFALQVFQQMRTAGISDASYDPDAFAIRYGDGVLGLHNLYDETVGVAKQVIEKELARVVPALVEPAVTPRDWATVRSLLRPVLRPATHLIDASTSRLRRPVFPFVDEVVAVEHPETIGFPDTSVLTDWGVSAAEVFDTARRNLAEQVSPMELPDDGVAKIVSDNGNYLPSWLLLHGWLAASTQSFGHPPVAFIPDQRTLLVVPGDPELVESVYETVEEDYREAEHPLSPQGYTLDRSGRVVPVDVLADNPHHRPAQRARALLADTEYDIQRDWLSQRYEDEDEPLYVSALRVVEQAGELQTVTVWGQDVDCTLPEADALVFACDDGRSLQVPFGTAVEVTGLAPIPGLRPRRYRTTEWPDDAVLARLAQTVGAAELPTVEQRRS